MYHVKWSSHLVRGLPYKTFDASSRRCGQYPDTAASTITLVVLTLSATHSPVGYTVSANLVLIWVLQVQLFKQDGPNVRILNELAQCKYSWVFMQTRYLPPGKYFLSVSKGSGYTERYSARKTLIVS